MRLKRLTLHGFKSFADRTDLDFGDGITAVVGPNGCGKSNVVDAMKWVLGEQSAKSLRGRQMQDVIFNGASNRKSMGMAEVTVSFETDGRLDEYGAEVVVTRRLYRSGQSEYLINNKPSRLRDIRDLFLDTGIGVDAYSLIEQGKVDILLQASNHERRAVLEEAAGISKYRVRRKEAQHRMENVEQNLLRVGDIVCELEKRVRSVKYQAGKARNWQAYTSDLGRLKSQYYLTEYHNLLDQQGRLRLDHDDCSQQLGEIQNAFDLLEAKRSQYDLEIIELGNRINGFENRLTKCSAEIESGRQTIALVGGQMAEQNEHLNVTRDRLYRQHLQLDRIREDRSQIAADLVGLVGDQDAARDRIAAVQERTREREVELAELADTLETDKSDLIELMRRCAQFNNQLNQLDIEQRNIAGQRERLISRKAHVAEEKTTVQSRLAETRLALAEIDQKLESIADQMTRRQQQCETLKCRSDELSETLAAKKEQRSASRSRYEVLADMEAQMEGVGSGARELLKRRDQGDPSAAGIVGLVADLIHTDMEHAMLIEAALSGRERFVVVQDTEFLSRNHDAFAELDGSVNIFPLDLLGPVVNLRDCSHMEGVIAVASDFVRTDEQFDQLARVLLGKTLVVADLATALRLCKEVTAGWRFVTTAGEVVECDGSVRVGPVRLSAGLISRRSELEYLERELSAMDETIEDLAGQADHVNKARQNAEQAISQLRSRLYELRAGRVKDDTELTGLDRQYRKIEREDPIIASELAALDSQRESGDQRRLEVRQELEALDAEQKKVQRRIESRQADYQDRRQVREALGVELTELKVQAGRLAQKRQALDDRANALQENYRQSLTGYQSAADEIESARARIDQAERQILRTESTLAQLYLDRQDFQRASAKLRAKRQVKAEQMEQSQDRARQLKSQVSELQTQTQELAMKINELTVRQETLIQRVQEELQIDLEHAHAAYEPGQVDWERLEAQISELKGKIARLGNVNLDAIAEQEQLEARLVFLTSQREDLLTARKRLEELIERLDNESEKRFVETFEAVRANFQELFRKLFGGGKADIVLDNPDDVLDSGIDIFVRPPGKETRSVSLLSGGEKTLTTVALLMAIFKSRPSPFCILDEVDAALDEANIDRFNMVLQEFLKHSQFVIITHSKRTMTYTDVLYGITMQEAGISKKVAVKFNKDHTDRQGDEEEYEAA